MSRRVAIFGIGPSGMVAAWAALRAGYGVTFFSETNEKSTLYGCQYLHAPIPGILTTKVEQTRVQYRLNGTAEEYRRKVYGDNWQGSVSPEDLAGEHDAWDIRATYDALCGHIMQHKNVKIAPAKINHDWLTSCRSALGKYAHVISTIPAIALCEQPCMHPSQSGHYFQSHSIKAIGAPAYANYEPDLITCSGLSMDLEPWYRRATVFGHTTIEYPRQYRASNVVSVRKPLVSDCDCHPEIIRMGRYGEWKKGVLVHQVYDKAVKLMNGEWV